MTFIRFSGNDAADIKHPFSYMTTCSKEIVIIILPKSSVDTYATVRFHARLPSRHRLPRLSI